MLLCAPSLLATTKTAAMIAASGSSTSEDLPSETAENTSLTRALCHSLYGLCRREFEQVLVPPLLRRVNTLRHRVPLTVLDTGRVFQTWHQILRQDNPQDIHWIDIGSGDTRTLRFLAESTGYQFIGVDKENSLPLTLAISSGYFDELPVADNIRNIILSWNKPGRGLNWNDHLEQAPMLRAGPGEERRDLVHESILHYVGAAYADFVSLFFPYSEHPKLGPLARLRYGPARDQLEHQLKIALDLLQPGGVGLVALEASPSAQEKRVLQRALDYLRAHSQVASIHYAAEDLDVRHFGILPYAPTDTEGNAIDTEALENARFIFFERR